MSQYLGTHSRATPSEPYFAMHAGAEVVYGGGSDVAAHPIPSESCDRLRKAPIRIDLPHLDVVLSISVEGRSSATSHHVEQTAPKATTKLDVMRDPIVEQLFCDFNRPELRPSNLSGVYTDAVRLAVLARWLGLCCSDSSTLYAKQSPAALPKWRLRRVIDHIDENISGPTSLAALAEAAGLSKMYFAAQFRAATGLRPHEYVLRRRVDRAKHLLTETQDSIAEISFSVGFQTQAHFTMVFKRIAGATPGQWRALGTTLSERQQTKDAFDVYHSGASLARPRSQ